MPRIEAPVWVRCAACAIAFQIAATNARAWRRRGEQPRCASCRGIDTGPRRPTQKHRDYWTERFTLEEIRELATGIWPELAQADTGACG